jgi:putative FmdB family regulatory protein
MPIYVYECARGHRAELFRSIRARNRRAPCPRCGKPLALTIARSHVAPDGVYSYAPNIGSADRFERQQEAMRAGKKVIPRVAD